MRGEEKGGDKTRGEQSTKRQEQMKREERSLVQACASISWFTHHAYSQTPDVRSNIISLHVFRRVDSLRLSISNSIRVVRLTALRANNATPLSLRVLHFYSLLHCKSYCFQ